MEPEVVIDSVQGQAIEMVSGNNPPICVEVLRDLPQYRPPSEDEKNRWQSKS